MEIAFRCSLRPDPGEANSIPDSDRTWLSVGARYNLSKASSLDLGYARLFLKDANIQETVTGGGTLTGKYTSHADIISVQFNQAF